MKDWEEIDQNKLQNEIICQNWVYILSIIKYLIADLIIQSLNLFTFLVYDLGDFLHMNLDKRLYF